MASGRAFRIGLIDNDLIAGLQFAAADFHFAAIIEAAHDADPTNLSVVGNPYVAFAFGVGGFDCVIAARSRIMMMVLTFLGTRGSEAAPLARRRARR
jgi:hypothetical protein